MAFATDEHPVWAVLAGLTLGQVFLARIDAVLLLVVPLGWLICAAGRRPWREILWFVVPFGAMLLHGLLHALLFSWPCTLGTYGSVGLLAIRLLRQAWWLIVALLLLGGALLWATRRLPMRLVTGEQMVRCAAAAALVASVCLPISSGRE